MVPVIPVAGIPALSGITPNPWLPPPLLLPLTGATAAATVKVVGVRPRTVTYK
jgi:hypothetical protein